MSHATPTAATTAPLPQRLQSLDTYRGLIMVGLAFNGFGLAATARNHLQIEQNSGFWKAVQYQFGHAEWVGCALWDLIQPSFMFMVGVSMAYSYVNRQRLGHSWPRLFGHACWRSAVLIALGIFLISNGQPSTNWSLMNVLTQIGLGYPLLFLMWGRSFRSQALVAAALLAGMWLLYVSYPRPGIDPATGAPDLGVTAAWASEHLAGVERAWHKNANIGHAIDLRLLNGLPRNKPFVFSEGGYQTINFIPSLATMIFGLMCGELLRSNREPRVKWRLLLLSALGMLAAGWLLHTLGYCPLVKRIWTPSWTLFSTGWCMLILATLYAVIDLWGLRSWTFPLVVVGMNSVAIYSMSMMLKSWVGRTLATHFGPQVFLWLGPLNEPLLHATLTGLVFWLICWWMFRQRIFIRV